MLFEVAITHKKKGKKSIETLLRPNTLEVQRVIADSAQKAAMMAYRSIDKGISINELTFYVRPFVQLKTEKDDKKDDRHKDWQQSIVIGPSPSEYRSNVTWSYTGGTNGDTIINGSQLTAQ